MAHFAAGVLIVTADGLIPSVKDPHKPSPLFWKVPGGTQEGKETPEECARREVLEECGIDLNTLHPDPLPLLKAEKRDNGHGPHTYYMYAVLLNQSSRNLRLKDGVEGEVSKYLKPQEVLGVAYLPDQQNLVSEAVNTLLYCGVGKFKQSLHQSAAH